jgi:hypothetical protein
VADRFGRVLDYEEGADLHREPGADYRRWPGIVCSAILFVINSADTT